MNRRKFAGLASAGVGGLFAGSALPVASAWGDAPDPAEKRLVLLGLNALARAHAMSYFADGHRGASLVAAHLLITDNGLPAAARSRIEQLFDANWATSPLCRPFPETDPAPDQLRNIGEALMEGRGQLREVGHNAIFAMLALRGFRLLPEAATPERIDGVCRLIRAIRPWRDEKPDPAVQPPPFKDGPAASRFILREASAAVDRFKGFGQGFSGHMLTFGQALVEMAALGDEEWAESCRLAYRKYVTVTRKGPQPGDRRIADHAPNALRPNSTAYWRQRGETSVDIGHVFKYPYSYYDLLRRADSAELRGEWEAKADQLF